MTKKSKTKGTRQKDRSPKHPSVGLAKAVKLAQLLYAKERRSLVSREVAVQAWGYNSLHGRSLSTLAAVAQYGLLRRQSGRVGISEDAFVIVAAPRDSDERRKAIERCATTPIIFNEILEKHPDDLPSDDSLAWDLTKQGFTEKAAKTVIDGLRETIMFVKQEAGDYNGGNMNLTEEKNKIVEMPSMPILPEKPRKETGTTWTFPLLGKTASVSIVGGVPVQEDVDLLTRLLEAFKAGLDKKKAENNDQ